MIKIKNTSLSKKQWAGKQPHGTKEKEATSKQRQQREDENKRNPREIPMVQRFYCTHTASQKQKRQPTTKSKDKQRLKKKEKTTKGGI